MTNINFRQGLKADLPSTAPASDLLFTTDTGEIFKGTGASSPLLAYGSVLYGFADLAALNLSTTPKILGKVYLTDDNKLYRYNGTTFVALSGETGDVTASEVSFANAGTGIDGTNVQQALEELAGLVQYQEEESGKVKLDAADDAEYLYVKFDQSTIKLHNSVLKAFGIDGLTLTGEEVQDLLDGATGNIQDQLDLLNKGVVYVGRFPTITDIPNTLDVNGNMVVIDVAGESSELYIYSEANAQWESIGKFEFAETFIGLKDTPTNYSSGKFVKSSATGIIFGDVDYSEILNAPTLTELEQAIEFTHEHANKSVLDKFAVDTDGDLTYDGEKVMSTWGSFE